jgi:hypothetical protein
VRRHRLQQLSHRRAHHRRAQHHRRHAAARVLRRRVRDLLAGVLGVWALQHYQPLGPNVHVPSFVYYLIVAVATLFGAWEGGLIGVASENKKLARFHDDLEAGKYLILIYALKAKEDTVRAMMRERHPEAELVAVDSHYINPFSSIKREADGDRPGPRAQQKV